MADFEKTEKNMVAHSILAPETVSEYELVQQAFSRPEYMWRTAEGIAKETNLSVEVVDSVIREMSHELIRSAITDEHGRARYTTLSHYRAHAGILRRVLDTLSDQVR